MAKILATFTTLVRHLSGVNSFVLRKVVFAAKGLATFTALVGPLPSVDPLVLHERGFAAEGLPARPALIRPLSRVDFLVLHKRVLAAEGLPTFAAVVMHLSGVTRRPALAAPGLPLGAGGLGLVAVRACPGVLAPLTHTLTGLLWWVRPPTGSAVPHKRGLAFVPPRGFLCIALLLALVAVCPTGELPPTRLTGEWFQSTTGFLVGIQVQSILQEGATHVTRVSHRGGRASLGRTHR